MGAIYDYTVPLTELEMATLISCLEQAATTLECVVARFPEAEPMLANIQALHVRLGYLHDRLGYLQDDEGNSE